MQAWRHVYDIFVKNGATNATRVWSLCASADKAERATLAGLYPGDSYVDWLATDGYNERARSSPWHTFAQVFGRLYGDITAIFSNPLMIAETSSAEEGGSKAAWITDAFETQLPNAFSWIRAVTWFDSNNDVRDWWIESSPAAQTAFAAAIQSSYYATNQFSGLNDSPIPAPISTCR